MESRYAARGLQVIGIHTPEFEHEKKRNNVVQKVKQFELRHPIMLDNDFAYWRALDNHYWPSFYLVDKKGVIRARFVGEMHTGDRQAQKIEQLIVELLVEK